MRSFSLDLNVKVAKASRILEFEQCLMHGFMKRLEEYRTRYWNQTFLFFHHASVIPSLSGGTFAPWRNWSLGPQSRQLENEMRFKDSTSCKVLFWEREITSICVQGRFYSRSCWVFLWLVDPCFCRLCSTWQNNMLTTDNLCKNTSTLVHLKKLVFDVRAWQSFLGNFHPDLGFYGQIFHWKMPRKSVHSSSVENILRKPSRIMSTFQLVHHARPEKNTHIHTSPATFGRFFIYVPYFPIFLPPWCFRGFCLPKRKGIFCEVSLRQRGCTLDVQPDGSATLQVPPAQRPLDF